MRKAGLLAFLAGLALLVLAAAPAYADDPHGFNGTVKIHAEPGESEPIMANEPHVCAFHIHGFNFDGSSTGWWTITAWPPTGDGSTVVSQGNWGPASASGEWKTAAMTLPDGHYKLAWDQTNPAAPGGEKHKVFWVECNSSGTTGTTTSGTTTSGTTTSGTTTTGTTTSGTTTGGTTTAGTTTTGSGTTTGGTTTTAGTTTGGQGNVTTGSVTTTGGATTAGTTSGGNTGGTEAATTGGGATGGTEAATTGGNATGATEAATTGGNAAGAVSGVVNLPSTSTSNDTSRTPLIALGFVLMAAGGLLLARRREITIR